MNLEQKDSAATTTTHDVLTHHLNSFGVGDIVGTMPDYTVESKFFTSEGLLRGPDAIRSFFVKLFQEFAKPGTSFEMHRQEVDGGTAYIVWKAERMGPPPRSFAADAHGCIMVRSLWTYRIQGCGASPSCPDCELPSDASSRPQRACRRARVYQGAAWKRRRVRPAQSDGRP
jgi:hypothetical protein